MHDAKGFSLSRVAKKCITAKNRFAWSGLILQIPIDNLTLRTTGLSGTIWGNNVHTHLQDWGLTLYSKANRERSQLGRKAF